MRIIILLLALAVFIAGVFCPIKAYAQEVKPWDCTVSASFEGVKYTYTLSQHLDGITSQSKSSRAVYCSARLKKERAKQLLSQGYSFYETVCYLLPDIYEMLSQIEKKVYRNAQDASVAFAKDTFTYTQEVTGRYFDKERFCIHLLDGLTQFNTPEIEVSVLPVKVTKEQLKERTLLRASYTTVFSWSGQNRQSNIALALGCFDGLKIAAGQSVSFNQTVGERTQQRGYQTSKIIIDGKYVEGVGGGVCQASTAIYNAALLANLQIDTRSRHTLVSHYVEPSFDAMVSSSTDLVFTNNTPYDLYLSTKVANGRAQVKIYGCAKELEVVRVSEVIERKQPEEKTIIDTEGKYGEFVHYDDQMHVLESGSDFVKSRAYLHYYKDGVLVSKKLLSTDTYKEAQRVVVRGAARRPQIVPPPLFIPLP